MAVLSALRQLTAAGKLQGARQMGGMTHVARPSRWAYDKFKDDIHFYVLLAAIPLSIFTAYMNITVGQAKLAPIPEGYKPKEWEYFKNPISRLMVKYCKRWSLQQEYEINLHGIWEATKVAEMRALKMEVQRQQQIHGDYKGWYHKEDIAHYSRQQRAGNESNMNEGRNQYEPDEVPQSSSRW